MSRIQIFYTRPPRAPDIYEQALLFESPDVVITLGQDLELPGPKVIEGNVAMEPGSSIVWFTFPGRWHDIGKCYLRDGSFAGIYANVLTPVEIQPGGVWRTTDLCLDVWLPPAGPARLLDVEALEQAVGSGAISYELAARAEQEATYMMHAAGEGTWPPPTVHEWDLERALDAIRADEHAPPLR